MGVALTSYGAEPLAPGVVVGAPEHPGRYVTRARAQEIDARLRAAASRLHAEAVTTLDVLREARENNVHVTLGFAHWHEYIWEVFDDFRNLRLNGTPEAITERRALHASLADENLAVRGKASVRSIRELTGYSLGTIQADLAETGRAERSKVIDLEPQEPAPDPYAGLSQPREALARVAAQDDRGLTCRELEHETGWLHQSASPALRKIERRGWVRRDGRMRGPDGHQFGVYVVTDLGAAKLKEDQ
jgi:hypothetical protein